MEKPLPKFKWIVGLSDYSEGKCLNRWIFMWACIWREILLCLEDFLEIKEEGNWKRLSCVSIDFLGFGGCAPFVPSSWRIYWPKCYLGTFTTRLINEKQGHHKNSTETSRTGKFWGKLFRRISDTTKLSSFLSFFFIYLWMMKILCIYCSNVIQ